MPPDQTEGSDSKLKAPLAGCSACSVVGCFGLGARSPSTCHISMPPVARQGVGSKGIKSAALPSLAAALLSATAKL